MEKIKAKAETVIAGTILIVTALIFAKYYHEGNVNLSPESVTSGSKP